jgi:hypothetical protein
VSNILEFEPPVSYLDIPAEKLLNEALNADLEGVVVLGWTNDGLSYFSWSYADAGESLLLLELAKRELLEQALPSWSDEE